MYKPKNESEINLTLLDCLQTHLEQIYLIVITLLKQIYSILF